MSSPAAEDLLEPGPLNLLQPVIWFHAGGLLWAGGWVRGIKEENEVLWCVEDEFVKEDLADVQESKESPPRIEQEHVEDMRTLESTEGLFVRFSIESYKESFSSSSSPSFPTATTSTAAAAVGGSSAGSDPEGATKPPSSTVVPPPPCGGDSSIMLVGHLASFPLV